jgi:hypothetical protein
LCVIKKPRVRGGHSPLWTAEPEKIKKYYYYYYYYHYHHPLAYFKAVQPDPKTVQSHWSKTSYSTICQKLPNYKACTSGVLRITAFCVRIYRAGWKLSSAKVLWNSLETIPVVDSNSGILQVVFHCHLVIRFSFKSVCFWCLSVTVLWRSRMLRIVTSTEYAALIVLSTICLVYCYGQCTDLLWTCRSIVYIR